MTKKLVGLLASVTLLGSGMALAQGQEEQLPAEEQVQQEQPIGGAGEMAEPMKSGELSGEVLKASSKEVQLKLKEGPIVTLKVAKDTKFEDPAIKRASDLKPGEEVQVKYEIEGTENRATSIGREKGQGGAGYEEQHEQMPQEGQEQMPQQEQ